jgi:hypothetical protein
VERAETIRGSFELTPDNAGAVAAVCRRLDGLPLALELAASRAKVLDPPLLVERLANRLPVLTGGSRDAPERHQTLRATIEWSYALLEHRLQALFCRLAVFAGSFSLEAAERIANAELEDIAALVDWSLLKPIGAGRFLMLETIREYARELFEASDEYEAIAGAHLETFLDLAEEAEWQLVGPDQRAWYDRLAEEQDNLRAALEFACTTGDGERSLRLAASVWRFWWNRGQLDEGQRWYDRGFAAGDSVPPAVRARALLGASHMSEARGDSERTRGLLEEAVEIFRDVDDSRRLVIALAHLASVQRNPADWMRLNREALEIARAEGDLRNISMVTHNLAYRAEQDGDEAVATRLLEESLDGARIVGDTYGIAGALGDLARLRLRSGDLVQAAAFTRESVELLWSLRDAHTLAHVLTTAAAVLLALDRPRDAAQLCAADQELCARHGFETEPAERAVLMETTDELRRRLGDGFADAWRSGTELDLAKAVELTLTELAR